MAERGPLLRRWAGALLLGALGLPQAAQAGAPTTDPALEARVQRLASELRCLVCQNQTIADSHADLAVQLKDEVRSQLARGDTEAQVREFMVQRYGDFVLYRPPVNPATWLLWGGPVLLLGLGLGVFSLTWRARRLRGTDEDDAEATPPGDEVAAPPEGRAW